nr:hypothetical protein [Tanacetum cinerariifolium]
KTSNVPVPIPNHLCLIGPTLHPGNNVFDCIVEMGIVRETLAEGTEGAPHLGPERPRVYSDLSPEEKDRYNADIRATNILLQGLPKDIYTLINHYTDAKDIWDNNQGETIHAYYVQFAKLINDMRNIKMTMSRMQLKSKFMNNMLPEWGRFVTTHYLQSSTTSSIYVAPHLADNAHLDLGQARQIKCYNCNGIVHITRNRTQPKRPQNSDYFKDKMLLMQAQENGVALDEEQFLFLADDCDTFDSNIDEAPTAQTMFMANLSSADPVYDDAGLSYDSDILFENTVVDNSLTTELATYKEQVKLYEGRARFELMEREQKIDEQLRIVITDRNFKEETLKKELHSLKLQIASTINYNKLMVEEVTSLKNYFKQKENK